MSNPPLNTMHPDFVLPVTDEMKKIVHGVEKATNSKVVLFSKGWSDNAIRAAHLSASLVAWKEDPKLLESPYETVPLKQELCRLTDLEAWHPFKPQPCPLTKAQIEEAMVYFRTVCLYREKVTGEALPPNAGVFMKWAKEAALEAANG